jgi:hypothetical protein
MMGQPQLECVFWRDAHDGDHNWFSAEELEADTEEAVVVTVGWIVPCRKPRYVAVAQSMLDYFESVTGIIYIPEENIVARKPLAIPEGGFSIA